MCSDRVIQVENVSKCFYMYDRPINRLKQLLIPNIHLLKRKKQNDYHREFWALNNVSFEVFRGQTVGIIGQNGSGKSTLLQIITGLMRPTQGSVKVHGKIGALLELGSGFNPEFTGRENVYLNGTLLGLTDTQMTEKFDDIVAFADIGEHLEQPVKTYSSGMMVRLAFAVQVFVESEILIIDEALAVGDARFQLKCFKRLDALKASGTTILFVSHAHDLVRSFCDMGLVLENGKRIYWGDARTATSQYLASIFPEQKETATSQNIEPPATARIERTIPSSVTGKCLTIAPNQMMLNTFGVGGAGFDEVKIYGLDEPNFLIEDRTIRIYCKFTWEIDFLKSLIALDRYEPNLIVGVALADKKGTYIFGCNNEDVGVFIDCLKDGTAAVDFQLRLPYLAEGDYFLTCAIALGCQRYHIQLKWYDCFLHLKYIKTKKNVFGIIAVNYQMDRVELGEQAS